MKILLAAFAVLLLSIPTMAQVPLSPYLKTKKIPDFTLLSPDSIAFNQAILKKDKPSLFMLFNPECGHCKDQLEVLLGIPVLLQSYQVLMITTETFDKINKFSVDYNLAKYPNIILGRDRLSFFGGFFQPRTIPVLVFYDKNGNFKKMLQGGVKRKEILEAMKSN